MAVATFPLYDALLHGQLEKLLRGWRSEGLSTRDIALRLSDRLPEGQTVSHTSVSRWCAAKEIPKGQAA